MKTIDRCSPGAKWSEATKKILPMLTVYFTDGEVTNYVADVEFADGDPEAIGPMWQVYVDELRTRYDIEKPGDWHLMTLEIIEHFKMTPDTGDVP